MHAQRILIHESLFDELAQGLVEEAKRLRVGNPLDESTDIGPMITESEAIRVERLVHEAVEKGATLMMGGERRGAVYKPTLLTNVSRDAAISSQEIFGPVVVISRFRTMTDAIDESNNTRYGLHAGIFTKSIDNALRAISQLRFGAVLINDASDFRVDFMPFGGMNRSGLGREGVRFAIEETMTEIKTVIFRKPA